MFLMEFIELFMLYVLGFKFWHFLRISIPFAPTRCTVRTFYGYRELASSCMTPASRGYFPRQWTFLGHDLAAAKMQFPFLYVG